MDPIGYIFLQPPVGLILNRENFPIHIDHRCVWIAPRMLAIVTLKGCFVHFRGWIPIVASLDFHGKKHLLGVPH